MTEDPIVNEVRKTRDQLARQFKWLHLTGIPPRSIPAGEPPKR
jgi:hypothetical protein